MGQDASSPAPFPGRRRSRSSSSGGAASSKESAPDDSEPDNNDDTVGALPPPPKGKARSMSKTALRAMRALRPGGGAGASAAAVAQRKATLDATSLSDSGRNLLVQALSCSSSVQPPAAPHPRAHPDSLPAPPAPPPAPPPPATAATPALQRLVALQRLPENATCADCSDTASTWVSTTFGVFLCAACVGAHRSLGVDVSFTQSTTLDVASWTPEAVARLAAAGNARANAELEFHVPAQWPKPDPSSPGSYRREYVKAKYEDALFAREHHPGEDALPPVAWKKRRTMLDRTPSTNVLGKEEYVGIVAITVVRAEHLVAMGGAIPLPPAPAFYTNPYCVCKLGSRSARTKSVHRSLNPEWNEGPQENPLLRMSWDGKAVLRVAVWNREKIAKDRPIGSALVDIGALKTAASCAASTAAAGEPHDLWLRLYRFKGAPKHDGHGGSGHGHGHGHGHDNGNGHGSSHGHGSGHGHGGTEGAAANGAAQGGRGGREGEEEDLDLDAFVSMDGVQGAESGMDDVDVDADADSEGGSAAEREGAGEPRTRHSRNHSRASDVSATSTIVDEEEDQMDFFDAVSGTEDDGAEGDAAAGAKNGNGSGSASASASAGRHTRHRSITKLHLRGRARDAMGNLASALSPVGGSLNDEYYLAEDDEHLGSARRERGYFFVGKVKLTIAFLDLR